MPTVCVTAGRAGADAGAPAAFSFVPVRQFRMAGDVMRSACAPPRAGPVRATPRRASARGPVNAGDWGIRMDTNIEVTGPDSAGDPRAPAGWLAGELDAADAAGANGPATG